MSLKAYQFLTEEIFLKVYPIDGVETRPKKFFSFVKSIVAVTNNQVSYNVVI